MLTSKIPIPRNPLRLRMSAHAGLGTLDGGWWPQSRDLLTELTDLVTGFPPASGRIIRALFSPPDWDTAPRRIHVGSGQVKVGSFPDDDSHLMVLTTSDRAVLRVLVVPPAMSDAQGEEALLAASSEDYAYSAASLLDEVGSTPEVDPMDYWSDEGGSWQADDLVGRPGD
ncbi:MAG: DUF5994 family protein [Nocardioides sp.]